MSRPANILDSIRIFILIWLAPCAAAGALSAEPVPFLLCCSFLPVTPSNLILLPSSHASVGFYTIAITLFIFSLTVGLPLCGYMFLICIFISYIIAGHLLVCYPCHVLVATLIIINGRPSKAREDMSKLNALKQAATQWECGIMTVIPGGCPHQWRSASML